MALAFTPTDWAKALVELVRVTKPGGVIELVEAAILLECSPPSLLQITDISELRIGIRICKFAFASSLTYLSNSFSKEQRARPWHYHRLRGEPFGRNTRGRRPGRFESGLRFRPDGVGWETWGDGNSAHGVIYESIAKGATKGYDGRGFLRYYGQNQKGGQDIRDVGEDTMRDW